MFFNYGDGKKERDLVWGLLSSLYLIFGQQIDERGFLSSPYINT